MMHVCFLVVFVAVCARPASGLLVGTDQGASGLLVGSSSVLGATSSRGSSQVGASLFSNAAPGVSVSKWKVQGQVNLLALTDDNTDDIVDDDGPSSYLQAVVPTVAVIMFGGIILGLYNCLFSRRLTQAQQEHLANEWSDAKRKWYDASKQDVERLRKFERLVVNVPNSDKITAEFKKALQARLVPSHNERNEFLSERKNDVYDYTRIEKINTITEQTIDAQNTTTAIFEDAVKKGIEDASYESSFLPSLSVNGVSVNQQPNNLSDPSLTERNSASVVDRNTTAETSGVDPVVF